MLCKVINRIWSFKINPIKAFSIFIQIILISSITASSSKGSSVIHIPDDYEYIQEGINNAQDGDTILVGPGIHTHANFDYLGKALVIKSELGPDSTILLCWPESRIGIRMSSRIPKNMVLEGFTLDDGGDDYVISIDSSVTAIIRNNIFKNYIVNTSQHIPAVVIWAQSETAIITSNLFINNHGDGCFEFASYFVQITNNTFYKNGCIVSYGDNEQKVIRNNIFYDCDWFAEWNWTYIYDYNLFYNTPLAYQIGATPGPNDLIDIDPLFEDTARLNLYLTYNSPCINRGDPALEFNDPDGTRNDMGALYFPLYSPSAKYINFGNDTIGVYVYNNTPNVYWSFFDTLASDQYGYEIEYGIDSDWTFAEIWSSGPVYTSDTISVYGGMPLENNSEYYLRVRLNNGTDWGIWTQRRFFTRFPNILRVPSDYSSIQAAVDNSLYGDTVLVSPGTYSPFISYPSHPLTIMSEYGPEETMLFSATQDSIFIHILDTVQGSSLEGFTFFALYGAPKIFDIGYYTRNFKIKDNRFILNGVDTTIKCGATGSIIVERNLFKNTAYDWAIYSLGDSCQLINNTFDSCFHSVYMAGDYNEVYNNCITNSEGWGIYQCESTTVVNFNNLWNNYRDGVDNPNGISVDPHYINPGADDYGLMSDSWCIDAGNPDGRFNDPDGTQNDIGAYYYETPVSVEDDETSLLPKEFALYQNYPNPFNPTTTIEFTLPRAGDVRLEVFNIVGQKVVTLIDNRLNAGYYSTIWDGLNENGRELATGMYLYRLEASDYSYSMKMILIK